METEMTEHYGKVTNGVQRSEVDTRSGQEFETGAMLWTDQLEVAAIEREQARDVHAFGHRCDASTKSRLASAYCLRISDVRR